MVKNKTKQHKTFAYNGQNTEGCSLFTPFSICLLHVLLLSDRDCSFTVVGSFLFIPSLFLCLSPTLSPSLSLFNLPNCIWNDSVRLVPVPVYHTNHLLSEYCQ